MKMKKTCCGCIPLKTGCFLIAYLNLVLDTVQALIVFGYAVDSSWSGEQRQSHYWTHPLDKIIINDPDKAFTMNGKLAAGIVSVVVMFDIVLMMGLLQKSLGRIRVYLVFSAVCVFLTTLGIIGAAILFRESAVLVILVYLPCFCLEMYFLLVIKKYYHSLKYIDHDDSDNCDTSESGADPCEPITY